MKSIKTKLLLALLTSVLIPMTIVGFISGTNLLKDLKPLFSNMVTLELEQIEEYFELFFHDIKDTANYLSSDPAILNNDELLTTYKENKSPTKMDVSTFGVNEKIIYDHFKYFVDYHPTYQAIEFGTPYGGYIRFPLSDRKAGYYPPERGWYKTAMANPGKAVITKASKSSDGKSTDISIVKTVLKGSQIIGVISIKIDLDGLSKIIKEKKVGDDGYIMLIETDGTILVDSIDEKNNFKNMSDIANYKEFSESNFENNQILITGELATATVLQSKELNFKFIGFLHNEEVMHPFYDFLRPLIITALILAILFTIVSLFLSNSIATPIRIIAGILHDISKGQGDLSQELKVLNRDELGEMASSFNAFTGTMNSMVLSIKQSTIELTKMGEELANDMSETSSAITEITANIESTKGQINTQEVRVSSTSSAVEEITQNIESLNRMVDNQVDAVKESSTSINEMVANIGGVNKNIDNLDGLFSELLTSSQSGKIKITNVHKRALDISAQSESLQETNKIISGIAAQTNLLAMNAAIEAAHAGDAGKGFAVVADEIRKLAETSSNQSTDIKTKLKEITHVIDGVVSASKAAEEGFTLVTSLIDKINTLESEIKISMTRQMDESQHVSGSLERITDLTTGVKQGSEEMRIGNEQILEDVSILSDISKQILHSIEEISIGNGDINDSVLKVVEMSHKNRETIEEVFKRVSQFKLKGE